MKTINYAHLHISEPFLNEKVEDIKLRIHEDGGIPMVCQDAYGVQIDGLFIARERNKKVNK